MSNRLAMAHSFIETQRQARRDLIGAFLGGSVARGEEDASSDIDLVLVVEDGPLSEAYDSLTTWQDGIYVDVNIFQRHEFADAQTILADPYHATEVNDGKILFDPSGLLTKNQAEVRAHYMEPDILRLRLNTCFESLRPAAEGLPAAVENHDLFGLAVCPGRFAYDLCGLRLMAAGITPSSTRGLIQLSKVDPQLKARLLDLIGATAIDREAVLALAPLSQQFAELYLRRPKLWPFFVKKATWLAQNGYPQEALLPLWYQPCYLDYDRFKNTPLEAHVTALVEQWLPAVGWQEQETMAARLESAQVMWLQAQALVASL